MDLTRGRVVGNIAYFSLPYMLSYFMQMVYGLVDLFVIGQYCGVDSTTAVSNGAQVMHLLTVVIIGLAMGSTVHIARAVGARNEKRVSAVIGNTISVFLLLSVVLATVLLLVRGGIVRAINTPAEAATGAENYLLVCFAGIPFIVAYNLIASIFRGLGDSRTPMWFVVVACIANISLDYLFIGAWGMGETGAALATTLSQALSVVSMIGVVGRRRCALGLRREDLRLQKGIAKDIFAVGSPVALQDGLIQVAFLAITAIANARGLTDAAAVGIVEKFIGLLFIVPSAMLASVSTISAQNLGAGLDIRARRVLRDAMWIVVIYGFAMTVLFHFIPDRAVAIFTGDAAVVASGSKYLMGYVWDCIFAGIHFCFSGFFIACGYSIVSFCHNIASIVLARVPLAYLASVNFPDTLYPMGLATPLGSVVSVVICVVVYVWLLRKDRLTLGGKIC